MKIVRQYFLAREREREKRDTSLFVFCAKREIGFLITRAMPVHHLHLHASSPHAIRDSFGVTNRHSLEQTYRWLDTNEFLIRENTKFFSNICIFNLSKISLVNCGLSLYRLSIFFFREKEKIKHRINNCEMSRNKFSIQCLLK